MKNLCIVIQQNKKKEIEEIRTKYLPKTENKLDKIRKLDESATRKATIQSIVVSSAACTSSSSRPTTSPALS